MLIGLIFLIAIIAIILGVYKINKKEVKAYTTTEGVKAALTLVDNINYDTMWCGTFQLIWNDLKKEIGGDVITRPLFQEFEYLNKETFTEKDLSESSYYKIYGIPSQSLKEEITKAIKEKFNEDSSILDDLVWEAESPYDRIFYAMLKKDFKFTYKFTKLENGKFNNAENVKFFGAPADANNEIKNQVNILYYENQDDFAIVLHSDTDDIIFVKNPTKSTFINIYDDIYAKEEKYKGSAFLSRNESFKVPYISIKEKKEFEELYHKVFKDDKGNDLEITKALQTIEFNLDETGGTIKSEAGMNVKDVSSALIEEEEPRILNIDSTFAVFLVEKGKTIPYYAALIDDISKFQ